MLEFAIAGCGIEVRERALIVDEVRNVRSIITREGPCRGLVGRGLWKKSAAEVLAPGGARAASEEVQERR